MLGVATSITPLSETGRTTCCISLPQGLELEPYFMQDNSPQLGILMRFRSMALLIKERSSLMHSK